MATPIQCQIRRVIKDIRDLKFFYNIPGSPTRYNKLSKFFDSELEALSSKPFDSYSPEERVDYILLHRFLKKEKLERDRAHEVEFAPFIEPFAEPIIRWCESRQQTNEVVDPQTLAGELLRTYNIVLGCIDDVVAHSNKYSQAMGCRAAQHITYLCGCLNKMCSFYSGYLPAFEYWVTQPLESLNAALEKLKEQVCGKIIKEEENTIIGTPIGRDQLLIELKAEMIPYEPRQLLKIAWDEYAWCESQIKTAAAELGYAKWPNALEHVKNRHKSPHMHPSFVRSLVTEGAAYVKKHDLVTVPSLLEETLVIARIPLAKQHVQPFLRSGDDLGFASPHADMEHAAKLTTLRSNNEHFLRAEVFHEAIPGHQLQIY